MTSKNRVLAVVVGLILFVVVFGLTFLMKSKKSPASEELIAFSRQMNDLGYVGAQLLFCVDDNRCPASYDPQSALGLMPFVQSAEDELFKNLKQASDASENLSPVLEAVGQCRDYCSCAVWSRFLESDQGKSFDLDLSLGPNDKVECPDWSELSVERLKSATDELKYVESLQN